MDFLSIIVLQMISIHYGDRKKSAPKFQLGVYVRTLSYPNVNWMLEQLLRSSSVRAFSQTES